MIVSRVRQIMRKIVVPFVSIELILVVSDVKRISLFLFGLGHDHFTNLHSLTFFALRVLMLIIQLALSTVYITTLLLEHYTTCII